jgi:protease PrsW
VTPRPRPDGRTAPVRPAPLAAVRIRNWARLPACWLLVALLVIGAWRLGVLLRPAVSAYPVATALAIVLFALYAVPFMLFIQHLDYFEREPPVLLAAVFAWGALVAMAAAVPGNAALDSLAAKLASPAFAAAWGPALAAPIVEEPLKLLGVIMIALLAREQINSVMDGFVYGAVAGLGFQVMEDVLYAANAVARAGLGDSPGPVLMTLFARGFVAGLWSHTMFSALAGAGVGYAAVCRERSRLARLGFVAVCLLGAMLCHGLWNSPLLADGLRLGPPGILLELLVKGIPAFVVILALVRSAGHREATYYGRVLADLNDERIATPAEIEALATPAGRVAARRVPTGRQGSVAVARLQRAQAQLAVELSRGGTVESGAARRWYHEVLHSRGKLADTVPSGPPPAPVRSGWRRWALGALVATLIGIGLNLLLRALGL